MKRAALKQDLRDGTARLEEILLEPPEYVERAKVRELLLAVPRLGPVESVSLTRQEEGTAGLGHWILPDPPRGANTVAS